MPLYEFQCTLCGERVEVLQNFSDPPLEHCPKCEGPMKKLLSSPAIQFKGSGFYKTDYPKGGSSSSRSESRNESKGDSQSDSGSSEKSESKSESSAPAGDSKGESSPGGSDSKSSGSAGGNESKSGSKASSD